MKKVADSFEKNSTFPAQRLAAPFWLTGVGWSDHWSFWREGYRALMVTDTAFFRNPNYHSADDTPDTLDYLRLAALTEGLARMCAALADREGL